VGVFGACCAEVNYICIYCIVALIFEWDDRKNTTNRKKHKVSFEEAKTVFYDDEALFKDDPDHSQDEERFILLGMSSALRTLVVCHCYRVQDEIIRIISARKATRSERAEYERSLSL
jgi:uncharacterized DUF497 family protein